VVDVSPQFYTIEVTGNDSKITAILGLLNHLGIKEIARTGAIAMARSKKEISLKKEKIVSIEMPEEATQKTDHRP